MDDLEGLEPLLIILTIIVILFFMSKRTRAENKQRRKEQMEQMAIEDKEKLDTYRKNFPLNCENKSLSQIIDDYCEIMNEDHNLYYYRGLYTVLELDNIS